jgi:hypothetical protein
MTAKISAVLDQIEAQQQAPEIPRGVRALELLQMAYRGELKLTAQQMRAAIEALPFESPKLSATAVLHQGDFAQRLDRAIALSDHARLIEAQVEDH